MTLRQNSPDENLDVLRSGLSAMAIEADKMQIERLLTHIVLLKKWNQRLNLTSITTDLDMIKAHILDSLSVLPYVKGTRVLDIGSGGGFPGLPLAIINPVLEVTLLDSRNKKCAFLRYVVSELGLENIKIENIRAENYRPDEKFDTLAARALSSLSDLIRMSEFCITKNTRLLAMKGKYPMDEINALNDKIKNRVKVKKLETPNMKADRHLVILDF